MGDAQMTAPRPIRPKRSVLYVPANNTRALEKAASLSSDAIIFDLEDAIGPDDKDLARNNVADWFSHNAQTGGQFVIRVNAPDTAWGKQDFQMACACGPDAILLPKVNTGGDIRSAQRQMRDFRASHKTRLWAMIETPRGIANCVEIADTGTEPEARLDCLIAGTNDLAKETGTDPGNGRQFMIAWLMQIILAARAAGLDALDGVYNDFSDVQGYTTECRSGRAMGFDGKTLIHPKQIEMANATFGPSQEMVAQAQAVIAAFTKPENQGKGVIKLNGKMVERLHLQQAQNLLAKYGAQANKTG